MMFAEKVRKLVEKTAFKFEEHEDPDHGVGGRRAGGAGGAVDDGVHQGRRRQALPGQAGGKKPGVWLKGVAWLLAAAACGPTAATTSPDAATPDAPRSADAPPIADAGADAPPDAAELAPRYTSDRTLSPITAAVARNLRNIAAQNGDFLQDDVFAKIGDSITVDTHFVACFAGTGVDLDGRAELQPAIDTFVARDAAGSSSFERVSLAATVGWSADSAIAGDPSPVDEEVAAIMPRYAVVMFGTNDAASRSIYTYAASLWTIVDTLAAEGVVPIMSSVPPNSQSTTVDAVVPRFNAVSRGLAQARLFPYMDYYKEMAPLPNRGLGPDGLHPSVDAAGSCKLDAAGLQFGYNVRNLITHPVAGAGAGGGAGRRAARP